MLQMQFFREDAVPECVQNYQVKPLAYDVDGIESDDEVEFSRIDSKLSLILDRLGVESERNHLPDVDKCYAITEKGVDHRRASLSFRIFYKTKDPQLVVEVRRWGE